MAFYSIYSQSIKITYKTKLLSESTLFYCLCIFSNLFIPLFIVYRSDGFWRKVEFYREQPDIHFKHNLILMLSTRQSAPGFRFWSSYTHLNDGFRSDQLSLPYITNREIDTNGDGKYDELNIDLNVAIDPKDEVVGAQLILFFDYKLHSKVNLRMESIVDMKYESPNTGKKLRVLGHLKMHQKEPLVYRKHHIHDINDNIMHSSRDFFIEEVLESYIKRNFSTSLDINTHYNWYSRKETSENSSHFDISANIIYSEQLFYYRPGFWYLIKWAFIQYLCTLKLYRYLSGNRQ